MYSKKWDKFQWLLNDIFCGKVYHIQSVYVSVC